MEPRRYSSLNRPPAPLPPKRPFKRRPLIIAGVIVALFLAFVGWRLIFANTAEAPDNKDEKTTSQQQDTGRVRIIATGDTIAHDALNAAAKTDSGYDYYQFMKPLKSYFDKADVRFCNQAVPGGGEKFGIDGYPVFNTPLEVATDMNKLGCNVVNTGSNHTFDKGQAVIDAQQDHWDTLPNMFATAGSNRSEEEKQKVRYFETKGVKFAFVSYTTYSNATPSNGYGLTVYSEALAEKQLAEARAQADIVMVSMRWGTEYSQSVNAQQNTISQKLADWGADVVFGHGPHVLQPVKKLGAKDGRSTYVWYSLGNFLNAQIQVEALVNGMAVMDVDTKTKQITSLDYLPIYMHYEWTAAEKAREDLLARRAFTMVPLDEAAELLARSQNNTTIDAQKTRISDTLNKFTPVKILSPSEY